ncbi:MAG: GDSL-type esterase/lipase family protein [Leptolyngbyaceae cyanobacterium]
MQSLTGDCDAQPSAPMVSPPSVTQSESDDSTPAAVTVDTAIAPRKSTTPQFGKLCEGDLGNQLAVCAVPSKAREHWPAPHSGVDLDKSRSSATAVSPPVPVTAPAALDLPAVQRPVATPTLRAPQFSGPPPVVAANPLPSARGADAVLRPRSGSELFLQRQLALQSGQSYTRLSPNTFADQWQQVSRQPTYEDWQRLLAQEARAIAGGQGNNRLEIIVGDSFGLWLPPELLPRDRLWLNQSISGDTTAGILRRVSAFAHTRATTIHLMAGANDLKNGVSESRIVGNLQQTIHLLRQQHPQANIVVYSVLPTRRAEISNDRVRSLNHQLAAMTQQRGVEFRNVHGRFQDAWGHLRPDLTTDGLHLNAQGYRLWQQAILAWAQ